MYLPFYLGILGINPGVTLSHYSCLNCVTWWQHSSGSSGLVRERAEKHEIYAAAFGGHLFHDLFSQGQGGHGPLDPSPGSVTEAVVLTRHYIRGT